MTHESSNITISRVEARPYADSSLLDTLRRRGDLEVFALPNGGICVLDPEQSLINKTANTTVFIDADDTIFKSTESERALRAELFRVDPDQVGTRMFDMMRKSLHTKDVLGSKGGVSLPGVFDPLLAKAILRQIDGEMPYNTRLKKAKKMLRRAKREGSYVLTTPMQMNNADWIPEPYEFTANLLFALSDVTHFRPVVCTYGDPRGQLEKVLPLLLMKMISGAVIVTERKHRAFDYMLARPNSPLPKMMTSWIRQSNGKFLYVSEDKTDITRLLKSMQPIAAQRYGIVVSPQGAWSTHDYTPNRSHECGISEISFMSDNPPVDKLEERIRQHLSGLPVM